MTYRERRQRYAERFWAKVDARPDCVRLSHLYLGTKSDNAIDYWLQNKGNEIPNNTEAQHEHKGNRSRNRARR